MAAVVCVAQLLTEGSDISSCFQSVAFNGYGNAASDEDDYPILE